MEVPRQVVIKEVIEVPKIEERVVHVYDEQIEFVDKIVYKIKVNIKILLFVFGGLASV